MNEESDYSESGSEYSTSSENSEDDQMKLPPTLFNASEEEDDSEPEKVEKYAEKHKSTEQPKSKPLVKNVSVKKAAQKEIEHRPVAKKLPEKTQESESSQSEPEESQSSEEDNSPPKKKRASTPQEDKNFRDSTVAYFMDPRKLRRTPMPSLEQLSSPKKSPTESARKSARESAEKTSETKRESARESLRDSAKESKRNSLEQNRKSVKKESESKRQSKTKRESVTELKRESVKESARQSGKESNENLDKKKSSKKRFKKHESSSESSPRKSVESSTSKVNSLRQSLRESIRESIKQFSPKKQKTVIENIPPQRRFSVMAQENQGENQGENQRDEQIQDQRGQQQRTESIILSKPTSHHNKPLPKRKPTPPNKRNSSSSKSKTSEEEEGKTDSEDEEKESSESEAEKESESETEKKGDKKTVKKGSNEKRTRADEIREQMQFEEAKEKRELMYEFWLMEKQGIPVSKKYNIDDNIDEMRFEYHRLKSEGDIRDKIKLGWSMFSCVNSIGEMINQKFKPLGISMEGWSEELDSQRQEYEKVFRKIYKNIATRFYVRPGLQLMMMFGSQLLLFAAPRVLKKFQKKDEEDSRIQELDEKGNPIPTETVRKINELQGNVLEIRNQFSEQLAKMQQQQLLLLQAQQKFFETVTASFNSSNFRHSNSTQEDISKESQNIDNITQHNVSEIPKHNLITEKKLPIPESKKNTPQKNNLEIATQNDDDSNEYEWVEAEVTDDEPDAPNNTVINNGHRISKADESASDSIGEVITQMQPMVNMFRELKRREKDVPLDQYMYDKPPEIPETMVKQHEELKKKGFIQDDSRMKNSKDDESRIEYKNIEDKKEGKELKELKDAKEPVKPAENETRKSSKRLETWNLD